MVTRGGIYAECPSPFCRWSQTPSLDRLLKAAVDTWQATVEGRVTDPTTEQKTAAPATAEDAGGRASDDRGTPAEWIA